MQLGPKMHAPVTVSDTSSVDLTLSGQALSATVLTAGVDHGGLGGLSDDDHTGYALLAGRSGGQSLTGGTASGNDLTLNSTSNSTKGSIIVSHSIKHAVTTSTSTSLTLNDSNHIVLMNNSSNSTVTLPAASGNSGLTYYIKKIHSGTATVTIDGNASETIDGATTLVLYVQYDAVRIVCDGSNWHVISDELIPHHAKLIRSSAQTINHNTTTKVLLNSETFDVGGIGDPTTNNRIDIRRAGKYLVTGSIGFISGYTVDEEVWVAIYVGGVLQQWQLMSAGNANVQAAAGVTETFDLAAAETVELYVYQASGASLNTDTNAQWQPKLQVVEIR